MSGLILVAEDEGLSQRLVSAVIQYCGYEAKMTENGQELLDALRSGLIPDLILLDLEMPVMGGIDVLKAIHAVPADDRCPIVVFTANNNVATVREAVSLGADDFIVKPFKTAELAQRIKDLTFETTESELKALLHNLHLADVRLLDSPSLKKKVGTLHDVYPLPNVDKDKRMCIALPKGLNPQTLARSGLRELRGKVMVFRECGSGWKKIWPRSGRALGNGQVAS
ncbi:MAG: response regulator [Bdellovibrionota bacterium]